MTESLIGYIAAFLTTVAFLPQAIKTIQTKATHGISLVMYLMLTVGIVLWLYYGIMLQEYPIIIANGVTLVFSVIILILKLKHG
ncbi:MAG: SemiSWEET transporter [Bacteroidota bacterium]